MSCGENEQETQGHSSLHVALGVPFPQQRAGPAHPESPPPRPSPHLLLVICKMGQRQCQPGGTQRDDVLSSAARIQRVLSRVGTCVTHSSSCSRKWGVPARCGVGASQHKPLPPPSPPRPGLMQAADTSGGTCPRGRRAGSCRGLCLREGPAAPGAGGGQAWPRKRGAEALGVAGALGQPASPPIAPRPPSSCPWLPPLPSRSCPWPTAGGLLASSLGSPPGGPRRPFPPLCLYL